MKSAMLSVLVIIPAFPEFLMAAEPPAALALALSGDAPTLDETVPPADSEQLAGRPIGLVVRIYEMDTEKLEESLDFRPQQEDRRTVHNRFEDMRKRGIVKVIAEPHLVTTDGRRATILSGGEVPVLNPATKDTVAIDFIPFGTQVDVTPERIAKDGIRFRIDAEFSHQSATGIDLDVPDRGTNPVIAGRLIRTSVTLGANDILVLNDREARVDDDPRTVTFMTLELADLGVESSRLQSDGIPVETRPQAVDNRPRLESPPEQPLPPRGPADSFEDPLRETAGAPSVTKKPRGPETPGGSFFLKPGKSQLELVRGTWKSFSVASKDFAYGPSLLVESPDKGAITISGRNQTRQTGGPAKTESIEAGQEGEKYAADIWTIRAQRPGVATIRLIDDEDRSYEVEVTVVGDTRHFDRMVKQFHPNARVEAIELTEQSVVITGEATAQDATAIQEIAQQLYAQVLLRLKNQVAVDQRLDEELGGAEIDFGEQLEPPVETSGELQSDTGEFPVPLSSIGASALGRPAETVPAPDRGTALNSEANATQSESTFGSDEDRQSDPFPIAVASENVANRKTSQAAAPTTQIRFLNTGLIAMRTRQASGEFEEVRNWEPRSTWRAVEGQTQQIRYNSHRENVAQGSRTLFQFRTSEFRNDVWVNGLLLTAVGNTKTRYFLKHFPVDLPVENHEVIAAAKGGLVTRIVVMKEDHSPAATHEGTIDSRVSFTGPQSFEQAIEEGREQGELIAVLVLGPLSILENGVTQDRFRIAADQAISVSWDQIQPETQKLHQDRTKPTGNYGIENSVPLEDPFIADPGESPANSRSAGSVAGEMRQLRQEVRSLRQQLAKLVEVLGQEHATTTEEVPDMVIPAPHDSESGLDRGGLPDDSALPTPAPELKEGADTSAKSRNSIAPGDGGLTPAESFDPFVAGPPARRNGDDRTGPEPGSRTSREATRPARENFESPFSSRPKPVPESESDSKQVTEQSGLEFSTVPVPLSNEVSSSDTD